MGTIRVPGGAPAIGVRVVAIEVPGAARVANGASVFARITQTDNTGRYQLDDIPPGRYYIAAGPVSSQTLHPGTTTQDKASIITVTRDSQAINGIDFTLINVAQTVSQPANCCIFSGQIVTEDGSPLPNFTTLRVVDKGSSGNPGSGSGGGLFRIILRIGTTAQLSIEGLPPGYVLKSQAYGGNKPTAGPVFIDGKSPTTIVLTLGYEPVSSQKVTVRGRVSNVARELNATSLSFTSTIPKGQTFATSLQPDSSFEFTGIPFGAYRAGVLDAAGKEFVSSAVTVIGGAVSNLTLDFRNNPFPEFEDGAPARSPFDGGRVTEITGVVTQRYTRIGQADAGYFRLDVKDAATGTVTSWAVYAAREFHVPRIIPGETLSVPGTKSADGTDRLFASPF